MAKAKKENKNAVSKSTKASKGTVKKSVRGGTLIERNAKILDRQKVNSNGLAGHKKALFNISVVMQQLKEVRGFLAEETAFDITIKGRPVHSKGRKDHFSVIDRTDIVLYEGSKGEPCKAVIKASTIVATYANCTYSRKQNGNIGLVNDSGETVTIVPQDGIVVQIEAVIV